MLIDGYLHGVFIFAWVIRRGLLPWYLTLRHGSINAGVNLPLLTNIWLIPAERSARRHENND